MTVPSILSTHELRAGDWVQVRSAAEILSTLDANGTLDELPFMPEMLQHCGKRFRVHAIAHKTCDTIEDWRTIRRMQNAVFLAGVRCDGAAHGGCQAACLIFWKTAWLQPANAPASGGEPAPTVRHEPPAPALTVLMRATRQPDASGPADRIRYRCQATDLVKATTPMRWWDPRHYVKDLSSRNVRVATLIATLLVAAYNNVMRRLPGSRTYPFVKGRAGDQTPTQTLNLRKGELVRVRSKDEILATIDAKRKNRGMIFDGEMVPFCGKVFRVQSRVEHIIDERTGKMLHLSNPCLILEGVSCGGCLSEYRLFCKRSIYPYWREIWLERVEAPVAELPRRLADADARLNGAIA